jgi:hypothetical protein
MADDEDELDRLAAMLFEEGSLRSTPAVMNDPG